MQDANRDYQVAHPHPQYLQESEIAWRAAWDDLFPAL